jgi:hypothetical protein
MPPVLFEGSFQSSFLYQDSPSFWCWRSNGKMMKQKILACATIIQHNIPLQYQSTIFTEPRSNSHIHIILPVFAILSNKNSVHILTKHFLNIQYLYFLLVLSSYNFSSLMCATLIFPIS